MRTFLSRTTIVVAALTVCFWTVSARAQTVARPSGTSVAVIDLEEVFKAHPGLKAQKEQLKTRAETAEAGLRTQRQTLESLAEELKTLKPGTPDYAEKEKKYANIQADAAVQQRQKSRELMEQEAQCYYEAYTEVQQHIAKFCQSYGIQLVVQFRKQPIDPSKPQDVQMGLSRQVVYQNQLDITQHIIDSLNQAAGTPTQPNVGVSQRPPAIPRGTQR